jgi:ATP-dependent helicase/nuclease subunit A
MTKLTETQLRAVQSIDKNVLVAAGAGSGKTSVLVARAIEVLRSSPDAKFSQLTAVTYTRKAAGEMQTRIKQTVRKLSLTADQSERERWSRHLAEIDTAKIGTIHSLCESILKSFAFEAGIDPQFEQLDDVERARLKDAASKEALRIAISEKTAEHELLVHYSLEQLNTWLNFVLKSPLRYRAATEKFIDLDQNKFEACLKELLRTVQTRILKKLINDPRFPVLLRDLRNASLTDGQTNIGNFRLQFLGYMEEIQATVRSEMTEADLSHGFRALVSLADESIPRQGTKIEPTKQVKQILKAARDFAEEFCGEKNKFRIPPDVQNSDLDSWHHTKLLMLLAERAMSIYQDSKSTVGIDYDDLIERVSTVLLRERSKIKDHYHRSVSHILVDEFQDTNLMQTELIQALASPEARLFLIGDDKQSIFKFQGAEVALFNEKYSEFHSKANAADERSDPTELVVELSESFRSHPKIVAFFNAVFERLFIGDSSLAPYYAAYRPLISRVEDKGADGAERVEAIGCQAEDLPDLEAKTVANWVVQAVSSAKPIRQEDGSERPIGFGDIAVLLATNEMFAGIEKALSAAQIPYVRFGGRGFLERQEIHDMENLLDFLKNPNDDHALTGLLRSPFCALSDDLIHSLFVGQQKPFWLLLKQTAKEKRPGYQMVTQAYHLLNRFLEESHHLTVSQLLRKFIQTTSYDIALLSTRNGKQRSRNLWKLVQMAARHPELGCGEFAEQLRMMRELRLNEKDAPVDARNSVKLMTIHSSKGLEFPAVILPRLSAKRNAWNGKLLFHKEYGLALNNTRLVDETPPLYFRLANWLEKDMESAEKQRLLYVAITRARDYLTILVPSGGTNGQEPTFSDWLKKIIFARDGEIDVDTDLNPSGRVLSVPGSRATFLFRQTSASQVERLAPIPPPSSPSPTLKGGPGDAPLHIAPSPPPVSTPAVSPPTSTTKSTPGDVKLSTSGKVEQLSIFSLIDNSAPAEPIVTGLPRSESRGAVARVDYGLIEPVQSVSLLLPDNALSFARVTPRHSKVELSPMLVGNYFHALLERLPKGAKECDPAFLENVALSLRDKAVVHRDVLAQLIHEGKDLLEKYFESELFDVIDQALEHHHELPYLMLLEDALATRRADLLVRKPDGSWHVIDYKTDKFPWSEVERHAREHRKQLETYARELAQLLNQKVSAHLYFAQHGLIFAL